MDYKVKLEWSKIIKYDRANYEIVPEIAGVYEILVKQNTGGYKRRYIGQADNLRKRFLEHLSEEEPNECIKKYLKNYICGFDYALVFDENDRKDAEQALFIKYQEEARCNVRSPEGSGRVYNIVLEEINPF